MSQARNHITEWIAQGRVAPEAFRQALGAAERRPRPLTFGLHRLGLEALASGIAAAGISLTWLRVLGLRKFSPARDALWQPLGYAMVIALLAVDAMLASQSGLHWYWPRQSLWLAAHAAQIGALMVGLVFTVTAAMLVRQAVGSINTPGGMAAVLTGLLVGALGLLAHGLAGALLILLLGFAAGNRVLLGVGLLALAGFLSHYYYSLEASLLVKSMILACSGVVLLAARPALRWLYSNAEKHHA